MARIDDLRKKYGGKFPDGIEAAAVDRVRSPVHPTHGLTLVDGGRP
ncbi:MAG: hypothetical protein O2967_10780 [Proteobacteria bacterium]|nr:hypothetical protein [Pseudomonadota bacterium]